MRPSRHDVSLAAIAAWDPDAPLPMQGGYVATALALRLSGFSRPVSKVGSAGLLVVRMHSQLPPNTVAVFHPLPGVEGMSRALRLAINRWNARGMAHAVNGALSGKGLHDFLFGEGAQALTDQIAALAALDGLLPDVRPRTQS